MPSRDSFLPASPRHFLTRSFACNIPTRSGSPCHILSVLEPLPCPTTFHMADDERRSSKRSRFDQTEPEVKRSSRFDRRSRSPESRQPDTRRSRSPLTTKVSSQASEGAKSPSDPAAAAGKFVLDKYLCHSLRQGKYSCGRSSY